MQRKKTWENQGKGKNEGEINEKEIESLILELVKQGLTSEKIGLKLKEKNINAKRFGLKISKVLKNHNLYLNPDIKNLKEGVEKLKKHLERHKHDYKTKRSLSIKAARLYKLGS